MKRMVQAKLMPTPSQASALGDTLLSCNSAATWLSQRAFAARRFNKYDIHRSFYAEIRERFGLSAQPAVRVIGKVAEAYARSSTTAHQWRETAAQPYDRRCLSWQIPSTGNKGTVSIWTTAGRLKGLRISGDTAHLDLLRRHPIGETDLIYRNGLWLLQATIDEHEAPLRQPHDFLGVDMRVVNIATTSDGVRNSGSRLNHYRRRQLRLRKRLQTKKTSSARRLLRRRAGKEARFATEVNHKISKCIVAEAQRTGRGIAVEQLTGIRERARLRRPQRAALHTWAFHQLGQFLAYKAKRSGIAFVQVNPAYTSQTCFNCGYVDKKNRRSQALFICGRCGLVGHADHNAALNIARLGAECWGEIMRPNAAPNAAASCGGSSKPIGNPAKAPRARTSSRHVRAHDPLNLTNSSAATKRIEPPNMLSA